MLTSLLRHALVCIFIDAFDKDVWALVCRRSEEDENLELTDAARERHPPGKPPVFAFNHIRDLFWHNGPAIDESGREALDELYDLIADKGPQLTRYETGQRIVKTRTLARYLLTPDPAVPDDTGRAIDRKPIPLAARTAT